MRDNVRLIRQLAAWCDVKVSVDLMSGMWSGPTVLDGRPLCDIHMIEQLRLIRGGAIGVIACGWLDFKEAAKRSALDWTECVELTHPDQLARCGSVILAPDAHKRHDWLSWVPHLPRRGAAFADLVRRTASDQLRISDLSRLLGNADARRIRAVIERERLPTRPPKKVLPKVSRALAVPPIVRAVTLEELESC